MSLVECSNCGKKYLSIARALRYHILPNVCPGAAIREVPFPISDMEFLKMEVKTLKRLNKELSEKVERLTSAEGFTATITPIERIKRSETRFDVDADIKKMRAEVMGNMGAVMRELNEVFENGIDKFLVHFEILE